MTSVLYTHQSSYVCIESRKGRYAGNDHIMHMAMHIMEVWHALMH